MGLNDHIESSGGPTVAQDLLNEIVSYLFKKRASYASEIAHGIGEDEKDVAKVLKHLYHEGLLVTLKPKTKHSDRRLLLRRQELWRRGVKGVSSFQGSRTWYAFADTVQIDGEEKHLVYIEEDDAHGETVELDGEERQLRTTHVVRNMSGEVVDYIFEGEKPEDYLENDILSVSGVIAERSTG